MTHRALPLFAAATFAAVCSAQVSVSATALTPIVATASGSGGTATQSLPIGPLPFQTFLHSGSPGVPGAQFQHFFSGNSWSGDYGCMIQAAGGTVAGGTASIGPCEILVEMQAPQTTYVHLEVTADNYTVAGTAQPRIDIDVGNDGVVEYFNGHQAIPMPALTVGPQKLQLRLILEANAGAFESAWLQLDIKVRPQPSFGVLQTAASCSVFGPGGIEALGSFLPNGVNLVAWSSPSTPIVLVLGASASPQLLPSNLGLPCLLVPSLDATIPLAGGPGLEFVIPASVRPFTFFAQTAQVEGGQLVVSNGLRINAW